MKQTHPGEVAFWREFQKRLPEQRWGRLVDLDEIQVMEKAIEAAVAARCSIIDTWLEKIAKYRKLLDEKKSPPTTRRV